MPETMPATACNPPKTTLRQPTSQRRTPRQVRNLPRGLSSAPSVRRPSALATFSASCRTESTPRGYESPRGVSATDTAYLFRLGGAIARRSHPTPTLRRRRHDRGPSTPDAASGTPARRGRPAGRSAGTRVLESRTGQLVRQPSTPQRGGDLGVDQRHLPGALPIGEDRRLPLPDEFEPPCCLVSRHIHERLRIASRVARERGESPTPGRPASPPRAREPRRTPPPIIPVGSDRIPPDPRVPPKPRRLDPRVPTTGLRMDTARLGPRRSLGAPSRSIHGRRCGRNTSGSPRTHTPEWMQTAGRQMTRMSPTRYVRRGPRAPFVMAASPSSPRATSPSDRGRAEATLPESSGRLNPDRPAR